MKMSWLGALLAAGLTYVSYASAQAPAAPRPSAPTAVAGNVDAGKKLYVSYGCWQCHGYEGQGSGAGLRIAPRPLPLAAFTASIRRPTNVMPPYTDKVVSGGALRRRQPRGRQRQRPSPATSTPVRNCTSATAAGSVTGMKVREVVPDSGLRRALSLLPRSRRLSGGRPM